VSKGFDADVDAVLRTLAQRDMDGPGGLAVLGTCISMAFESIENDTERYRAIVGFIAALTVSATGLEVDDVRFTR
jgi:Holliday junction resolvasome RuvABC ATP-dependent DNA helicase subunit